MDSLYVSINHFETATATEQQKGIAQKEILLPIKRVIGIDPTDLRPARLRLVRNNMLYSKLRKLRDSLLVDKKTPFL